MKEILGLLRPPARMDLRRVFDPLRNIPSMGNDDPSFGCLWRTQLAASCAEASGLRPYSAWVLPLHEDGVFYAPLQDLSGRPLGTGGHGKPVKWRFHRAVGLEGLDIIIDIPLYDGAVKRADWEKKFARAQRIYDASAGTETKITVLKRPFSHIPPRHLLRDNPAMEKWCRLIPERKLAQKAMLLPPPPKKPGAPQCLPYRGDIRLRSVPVP